MFLKLVKHELRETYRLLLPMFGGLLLMAFLVRGSIWLMENSKESPLAAMGVMLFILFILACVAVVVLTVVLMMLRYARSVHGDEGYLTNTLPVGVNTVLLSRVLISSLGLLCAYGVIYLSVRIATWKVELFEEIGSFLRLLLRDQSEDVLSAVLKNLGSLLLRALSTVLMIFAAISIGYSFNRGKVGMSFLFYFILAIGSWIISTILSVVLLSGRLLTGSESFARVVELSAYFDIALDLIFCGVYYFLAWFMTKRHLNLA